MQSRKTQHHRDSDQFQTTVGEVVSAFYDAALAVLGDRTVAHRVAALLAADALRRGKVSRE